MKAIYYLICISYFVFFAHGNFLSAQTPAVPTLTIPYIMQDPSWIGASPSGVFWSEDSKRIYFKWNPEQNPSDSLYRWSFDNKQIEKLSLPERQILNGSGGVYNSDRTQKVYEKYGDIFLMNLQNGSIFQVTHTTDRERSPRFIFGNRAISFIRNNNIFSWEIETGKLKQLSDFRKGNQAQSDDQSTLSARKRWLKQEERSLIQVLRERDEKQKTRLEQSKREKPSGPKTFYYGNADIDQLRISPDASVITFRLRKDARGSDNTVVPNYIVSSGYTGELRARPKVGSPQATYSFGIYHISRDTVFFAEPDNLPGLDKQPQYLAEYMRISRGQSEEKQKEKKEEASERELIMMGPVWSKDSKYAVVIARSLDFKDRWVLLLDTNTGQLRSLDHQHDEAWIDGPGIGRWMGSMGELGWMPDQQHCWFQSEESGYSHLYAVNVVTGEKKALTSGKFEVFNPQISNDEKFWYFTSSEKHPGERHLYRMPIQGGKRTQLTDMTGNNRITLSPDEKYIAILHATSNRPWELFWAENKKGAKARRITYSLSDEFQAYPWRKPEHITFEARDGALVHARLYRPENPVSKGPAVIFVHGAGYLQNAHKWWSSYFREYMFHNFLADQGYTVLDMDFRASAGYGRDWRTDVYRNMGGKDLTDQVDGAKMLTEKYDISPERIGIYGGSYGGFITLMALFKEPGVFKAGAALRPVTDWAHYNHGYTASMLNLPQTDSLAYVRSSPIYHAEGLSDALLICHGMVDTNVHFQDVVRLTQRLIELGKENWEVAMYPVEGHGFREPSSWTDEYRRIYKLFETHLK